MKKAFFLALISAAMGATAQTANNNSTSSATTNAQGNTQAVVFNSSAPSETNSRMTSTSTNTQNVVSSGTTRTIVDNQGSYTVRNVPSVNGPNLTTSNDTCMGSTSASANGAGVGLSFGTTWTDEHCKRLKMSRELWNKGMRAASLAMDCMDPSAMAALEMTGTRCPQSMTAAERVSAFGPQASPLGAAPALPVAAAPAQAPLTTSAAQLSPGSAQVTSSVQLAQAGQGGQAASIPASGSQAPGETPDLVLTLAKAMPVPRSDLTVNALDEPALLGFTRATADGTAVELPR